MVLIMNESDKLDPNVTSKIGMHIVGFLAPQLFHAGFLMRFVRLGEQPIVVLGTPRFVHSLQ